MDTVFLSNDLRGSLRMAWRTDCKPLCGFDYDPFGQTVPFHAAADPTLARLTRRYTGQSFDAESGFYHYGARLYDDALARFMSADPAHQAFSPYAYCGNDPIDHVDRDGRVRYKVIYFNGWFLITDERNIVMAIFGESTFALTHPTTYRVIWEIMTDQRHLINVGAHWLKAALISLALDASTWTASLKLRLQKVIDYALHLGLQRRRREFVTSGYAKSASRGFRRAVRMFDTQPRLPSLNDPRSEDASKEQRLALLPFEDADKIARRYNESILLRQAVHELPNPKNPSKLKVPFELTNVLDRIQETKLDFGLHPALYLYLMRHRLAKYPDYANDPVIKKAIAGIDQQLGPPPVPSNTTTITSTAIHADDSDETHRLSHDATDSESESVHVAPAKPGGEKPHMSSDDDDTLSL